jgi:hypothetical protein
MFISWLVTAVLLSNAIGGFTSRRTCFNILSRFNERTNNRFRMSPSTRSIRFRGSRYLEHTSSTTYFASQSWSGAIYTFRPWKTRYITGERGRARTALLLLLAVLPIWAGMTGGFIIIWYTLPNGFNCRHFWLIGIFVAWHLSAFLTWLSYTPKFTTGKYHWHLILVKDAAIAIPSIVVIFLSSCGLFNSCFCWSGFFYYRDKARVPLNSDPFYQHNDRTIYPAVVAICLFFQCAVFLVVTVVWRKGLGIMRWSEQARHHEWETTRREHEGSTDEVLQQPPTGNQMELIRYRVLLSIWRPDNIHYYEHQKDCHRTVFDMKWDVLGFLQAQYTGGITQELGHVLAITGQARDAYCSTVHTYLELTWPNKSMILLEAIQSAIGSEEKISSRKRAR